MKIGVEISAYDPASGGIRTMHYLAYLCHRLGHQVDVGGSNTNPAWGMYAQRLPCVDFAVVAEARPATAPGSIPIVRWVLFFPGAIGNGPAMYPDHEMVVNFHPKYRAATELAAPGRVVMELLLPTIELPGIDEVVDRSLPGVVWVGKGHPVNVQETVGLPRITRTWPMPRRELILLMKRSKILYSFDPYSAINAEGEMCGCQVMVWDGKSFQPFNTPNLQSELMNPERDEKVVAAFIEQVAIHFNLKT